MKSFRMAAVLFVIAAALCSFELRAELNADNSGDVVKSFKVDKGGTLKIYINTGDIKIETGSVGEVKVRVSDVDDYQSNSLKIFQSGNDVVIKYNGSGYYNSSDVHVSIPVEYNVDVKTNQGDIVLRNDLKGNCQAYTAGGDITINSNVTGYVNVKTSGGDVVVGNVYGDLTLGTSGGDVTVGNIGGKGDIQTSGGDVTTGNVGKYLSAKTSGGDVTTGDIGGNTDINTMGGSINVGKVSGGATLNTNGGDIKILGSWGWLSARTYGGSINLYNINGSINTSTSAGDIYAELKSVKGSSKLESLNGSIKFYIDPNLKATIYANVNVGGWDGSDEKPIQSDFPAKNYDSGKYSGNVSATYYINGGGDAITIKTINDGIEIHKLRK